MKDESSHIDDQLDALADRFEAAWSFDAPDFNRYLDQVPQFRDRLLEFLIEVDIELVQSADLTFDLKRYESLGPRAVEIAQQIAYRNLEETSDSPSTTTGTKSIDNYRLLRVLGEGGMGTVWLAEQSKPVRRQVALKLIKRDHATEEIIQRFEAERQALAIMEHPNIAKVLDAGTTELGIPYFVMELVNGIPITKFCDDYKLGINERLELFIPVCKAIQHAHQKGIIHRDIKPSNVLVTLTDDEAIPKVIDFGLAKATEHTFKLTDKTMFTEFGKIVGTLRYMSPEQAELNSLDIDTRTDIYSLGVMLYELLTGTTPLDDKTLGENALLKALEIIRESEPPRPSDRLSSSGTSALEIGKLRKINPSKLQQILEGELDWVVMKSLDKDRRRRYATANELASDIHRYLNNETVVARPPSLTYQIRKFTKKNRGLVASLSAIAIVLIAGIVGTSWGLLRANNKAMEATAQQKIAEEEAARAFKAEQAAKELGTREIGLRNQLEENLSRSNFELAQRSFPTGEAGSANYFLDLIPDRHRNIEWHVAQRQFVGSDFLCIGHTKPVVSVAFSPNNRLFATGSEDESIIVWDVVSGNERMTLVGHAEPVSLLEFARDGELLVSASTYSPNSDDSFIRIWRLSDGKEIQKVKVDGISGFDVSNDGRYLAWSDNNGVSIMDLETRLMKPKPDYDFESVYDNKVAFSHDDRYLVLNYYVGFEVWDLENSESVSRFELPHRYRSRSSSFCLLPDKYQAIFYDQSAGLDGREFESNGVLNLVDLLEAKVINRFPIDEYVSRLQASPDGSLVVSDRHVIDVPSGRAIATLNGDSYCFALSPDGTRMARGSGQFVEVWDMTTYCQAIELVGHESKINCISLWPDLNLIASGDINGTAKVWNSDTGQLVQTVRNDEHPIVQISFAKRDALLVTADDRSVQVWETATGRLQVRILVHDLSKGTEKATGFKFKVPATWNWKTKDMARRAGIKRISISESGNILATSSSDGTVKAWDLESGGVVYEHKHPSNVIDVSPTGDVLLAAEPAPHEQPDSIVSIWDVEEKNKISELEGPLFTSSLNHGGGLHEFRWKSNKITLTLNGIGWEARAWNATSGELKSISSLPQIGYWGAWKRWINEERTRMVDSSEDETLIYDLTGTSPAYKLRNRVVGWPKEFSDRKIVAARDNKVTVWQFRDLDDVDVLSVEDNEITAVAISPDNKLLAIANIRGQIEIRSFPDGKPLHQFDAHRGSIDALAFDHNCRLLASNGPETCKTWDLTSYTSVKTFDVGGESLFGLGPKIAFHRDDNRLLMKSESGIDVLDDEESTTNFIWQQNYIDQQKTQDDRWVVWFNGRIVYLFDRQKITSAGSIRNYRKFKSQPKVQWHEKQATSFETQQNWFASTFHRAWLVKYNPDDKSNCEKFWKVCQMLQMELDAKDSGSSSLPSTIVEALRYVNNLGDRNRTKN